MLPRVYGPPLEYSSEAIAAHQEALAQQGVCMRTHVPSVLEVGVRGPGQLLGESAVLDRTPEPLTALCNTAVEAFQIRADDLLKRVPASPPDGARVSRVV